MGHAGDDTELVARASAGDVDAIEEIYRRHHDWIAALAYRFTNDRDEALDVLQDAFAYFLAKLPEFVLTSSLKAYFYPVVKHLSLDRRRRRRPTVDVHVDAKAFAGNHDGIRAVWARQKIAALEDEAAYGSDTGGRAEITDVALRHGLMSAYTAFVAVDSSKRTAGSHGTTVAVPVPMPEGVPYETTVEE